MAASSVSQEAAGFQPVRSVTKILVFTGNAGPGIATAAAATAVRAAAQGSRTLLMSLGPAAGMSALLGVPVAGEPTEIAARLDALAIDALADLAAAWERARKMIPAQLDQIAGDELPLLPGLEMSFGLLRLHDLASRYQVVVLDTGSHDLLLRALALPDGLRWTVRQLFGLDRGPGRSPASVARAILPTSFIPIDTLASVQDIRVRGEQLRALLTDPGRATARYVLRPDRPALEEARLAIPALQLHGLAVQAIIVGPVLPDGLAGTPLARLVTQHEAMWTEVGAIWPARQRLRFELQSEEAGLATLDEIGVQLDTSEVLPTIVPIAEQWEGEVAVAIELPGLPKNALQLTLSGDELIVRVGTYRRHILLPEGLRGITSIKATRESERLIVRRRNP
jgi:arsenite-transporting ATPase